MARWPCRAGTLYERKDAQVSSLEDELRQELLDKNKLEMKVVNGEKVFEMTKSEVNRIQGESYLTGVKAGKAQMAQKIREEGRDRLLNSLQLSPSGAIVKPEAQVLGAFIYWIEGLKFDES